MGIEELFKQFDWTKLAFFTLFALPGFISLQIWSLIVPTDSRPIKDSLPEAIGFGVLNSMVTVPLVLIAAPQTPWLLYAMLFLALVLAPALWPFLVKWCLGKLHKLDLILSPTRNAWDDLFLRQEPLFVIVHLKDGRRIGGYYGYESYAGVHPSSGHLYLEQIWTLTAEGKFAEDNSGKQ
jgi:hypothetical protein